MYKILIGSPVHQKPIILEHFLQSLNELSISNLTVDCLFVDDNTDEISSRMLHQFQFKHGTSYVINGHKNEEYVCNDHSHMWKESLIWKIASYKDIMIHTALEHHYDYLFLIDSDLVMNPEALMQLISAQKDIISNIFWTQWDADDKKILPQVWMLDHYTLFQHRRGEILSEIEKKQREEDFINKLKEPGVYEVGGLGACTLLSRNAMDQGINFKEIKNISLWGEDRHFCIRAQALGLSLYVDTHYPAYHIYRESDLNGLSKYKTTFIQQNQTILANIVHGIVRDGFQELGTTHYAMDKEHHWRAYFTQEMKETLQEQMNHEQTEAIQSHLKINTYVRNCNIINMDLHHAEVQFELTNLGLQYGEKFHEKFLCTCDLVRSPSFTWLINSFRIIKDLPIDVHCDLKYPNKITLSMIIKNEADRYLKQVLSHHRTYIDAAVIIDDGSEDHSVEICKELLQGIPTIIIRNESSKFSNEIDLRRQQWDETVATDPDWIINLDADEVFEIKFSSEIHYLINQQQSDVIGFRLYDFWDLQNYREDQYWRAHQTFRPFLLKYKSTYDYKWNEFAQHCGRFPMNIVEGMQLSPLRLKHLGWANPEDRMTKYQRYQQLDPDARYGWKEQYESILDPSPHLIPWSE